MERTKPTDSLEPSPCETVGPIHLTSEEIAEFVVNRHGLSKDHPLRRKILDHITLCRECGEAFVYSLRLELDVESTLMNEEQLKNMHKSVNKARADAGLGPIHPSDRE